MFKMKSLISALILWTMIISSTSATYNTSSTDNWYKTPVLDTSLNFTAYRDWGTIKMNWSTYTNSNFKYYKIIRSETLSDPVYPDNWYIKAISSINTSETNYTDKDSDSAVYRVCVITSDNDRYCSKTVKLDGYNNSNNDNNSNYEKTKTTSTITSTNTYWISTSLAKRADQLVAKFAIKIENKLNTDSEKIIAYESIITKLEDLADEKENLKSLISYLVEQLEVKKDKYNGDFEDIENIFKDID